MGGIYLVLAYQFDRVDIYLVLTHQFNGRGMIFTLFWLISLIGGVDIYLVLAHQFDRVDIYLILTHEFDGG